MTVIAAYKVRGGCVLAVDGRVTADDTLVSNNTPKHLVLGQCLIAFAGDLGPAQVQVNYWSSKACTTLEELRAHRLRGPNVDWYCLVYDRGAGVLATLCSDGCLIRHKGFAALGSGELVAWGFLAASRRPLTCAAARTLLHRTLQATAEKVTSCGGRATFLTAQGKTKSVQFHQARC